MHRLVRREQSSFLICRRKLHRFAGGFFQKQTPKNILFYVLVLLARMLMETRDNLYPALQFSIRPQESHQWGYSQEARSAVSTTAAINSPHVDKNRRHFTWSHWSMWPARYNDPCVRAGGGACVEEQETELGLSGRNWSRLTDFATWRSFSGPVKVCMSAGTWHSPACCLKCGMQPILFDTLLLYF